MSYDISQTKGDLKMTASLKKSIMNEANIPIGAKISFKRNNITIPNIATRIDTNNDYIQCNDLKYIQQHKIINQRPHAQNDFSIFTLAGLALVILKTETSRKSNHGVDGGAYFTYKRTDGIEMTINEWRSYYKNAPNQNEYLNSCKSISVSDNSFERNLIYFGAPGTGKSYTLKGDKKELFNQNRNNSDEHFDNLIDINQVEQVTFHPDYSYADFVGCYKPVSEGDTIKYQYILGPFLRILKNALTYTNKKYLLIIEEINRANIAAVFGDIFQLLDRDKSGRSEYFITPSDEIKKALNTEQSLIKDKLYIPSNMYIWATMNSADQGVFPMDTAFKRRWSFKYLDINSGEDKIQNKITTLSLNNNLNQTINWNNLRHAINNKLTEIGINEDKLLGSYFLKPDLLTTEKFKDAFKNKVLMYLFEDAAKHKGEILFKEYQKRFSTILKDFDERGINIFNFSTDNIIISEYGKDANL